jgi:hypothetical protein
LTRRDADGLSIRDDRAARVGAINLEAVQSLKRLLDELKAKPPSPNNEDLNLDQIVAAKSDVIARYGPAFSRENVGSLTHETFLSFLRFENNRHWRGLERPGRMIANDMSCLRTALALLVDESKPIRDRLERLRPPASKGMVPFLGPAILTAILQVVYPDRYGVLNNKLNEAMAQLGLWPHNLPDDSLASRYEAVNPILLELAAKLGIDLWTLDYLWWYVAPSSLKRSPP